MHAMALPRLLRTSAPRAAAVAIAICLTALLAFPPSSQAASATLTINVTAGNSIAVTISPTQETLTEDVTNPGTDWTFVSTPPSWFPAGVSNGWVYTPNGQPGCVTITVTTYQPSFSLSASSSLNPAGQPLAVYLAPSGSSTSCATPTTQATQIGSTAVTLQSNQSGSSKTYYYYLLVTSTNGSAVSTSTSLTLTVTAQ
jgi:hypothetical protein